MAVWIWCSKDKTLKVNRFFILKVVDVFEITEYEFSRGGNQIKCHRCFLFY